MAHKETLRQRWRKTTVANKAMVICTSLMALGTLFLCLSSVFQYYTMREQALTMQEQANIAREAMIANVRPYITVSVIDASPKLEAEKPIAVTLRFVNHGNAPAKHFKFEGQFMFATRLERPLAFIYSKESLNVHFSLSPTTIAPHTGIVEFIARNDTGLSAAEASIVEAVNLPGDINKRKIIVLYGEMTYTASEFFVEKVCFRYEFNKTTQRGGWTECGS